MTTPLAAGLIGAPTASAAVATPTNQLMLDVTSATTSPASGGPHAGDHVASYKWLIQKDTTGDPNQLSGPVAANDGTIGCSPAPCKLTSPSAPFRYTPGSVSPDIGVHVSGTGLVPSATIQSVTDAQHVVLSAGAYSGATVTGTYLFTVLRPDPCHPVTTGSPQGDPNFPAGCQWPSIQGMAHAPIVTQGDQGDWNKTQELSGLKPGTTTPHINMTSFPNWQACTLAAPCHFFVSVTADGYEISGTSFTVPAQADAGKTYSTIKVGLNAGPLVLGTMKILVFDDMAPTGFAFEATTEGGMGGFSAYITGNNGDQVSQDYFGNPLCTTYKTDTAGHTLVDAKGNPTVVQLGGTCVSKYDPTSPDPLNNGVITIPNLAPGRYQANVVPPDKAWIQTSTLEGGHDFDVWLTGNDTGYDTEMVAGGEPVPFVNFGFARAAMTDNNPTNPGAYASAGCRIPPPAAADGTTPTGDIRAQFTAQMQPCKGTNLTPRIFPGEGGQKATPDGSLQADSWQFPWDPAVYATAPKGEVKGHIVGVEPYVPGVGGLNGLAGSNGQAGLRLDNTPIFDAWVAFADLNNGDQTVMVLPAKNDGTFDVTNVPDGSYQMSWWDWNQDHAFDILQITVANGQVLDEGALPSSGWFTRINGHVFVDANANGIMDPGEAGVSDFLMQLLGRTNNAQDGGQNVATTTDSGFYSFKEAYPLGNNMVLQFFNTRYKTTGVTCKADNDPQQHTTLTGAVDLTTLNIISLNGFCDIGVQPYNTDPTANDNGGIVATAMYHPYRAETSQEQAFTYGIDTGQPGVRFELWMPRRDPSGASTYLTCTAALASDPGCPNHADGSLVRDPVPFPVTDASGTVNTTEMAVYDSEHYGRPGGNQFSQPGCQPRGADGQVLDYSYQQSIVPGGDCIEAPLQGTTFGFGSDGNPVNHNLYDPTAAVPFDPAANKGNYTNGPDPYPGLNAYCAAVQAASLNPAPPLTPDVVAGAQCGPHGVQVVDGNYGLAPPPGLDSNHNFNGNTPGDYIVRAVSPNDMFGKPLYKSPTEATNNSYDGPGWIPQGASGPIAWPVIPMGNPAAPGPTETGYSLTPGTTSPNPVGKCVGTQAVINNTNPAGPNFVQNASWVDHWTKAKNAQGVAGVHGGPFEGQPRPVCDTKLIHVQNGQSVAPNFQLYTDVPLATPFQGYAVDDISVSTNKLSTALGEVAGIPNMPIGIYDWTGRPIVTVNTDYNGQYAALLPSTNTFNCNNNAGPCPGVYRFVGNDPGQPYAPNINYNPTYKTIAATFQAWPNMYSPSDVAPSKAVVSFEGNGQQLSVNAICAPRASQPQVYAISHPFFKPGRTDTTTLTINGVGFGATAPTASAGQDAGVTLRNPDTGARVGAALKVTSWSDTQINVSLTSTGTGGLGGLVTDLLSLLGGLLGHPTIAPGAYQLQIQNAAGAKSVNAGTFHVMGTGYMPALFEVGTFNSGVLNQATGQPLGQPIKDNGYVKPAGPIGPVQDTADSTTGGFNPNNANFLPPGDPTAQDTRPGGVGSTSNAFVGDAHVKGAVQRSLEAAYHNWNSSRTTKAQNLIVVYPNFQKDPTTGRYGGVAWDPMSAYFENIIIHSPVALQGSGPGGMYKDLVGNTVVVPGATIDGRFFNAATQNPATTLDTAPGQEPWAFDWDQLLGQGAGNPDGLAQIQPFANITNEGEAVDVLILGNVGWYAAPTANNYRPTIDGLRITGGDQKGFPGNINEVSGAKTGGPPDETFNQSTQGGGFFLNAYDQHFQISNNVITNNSGTYGGAIRSGSPQLALDEGPNAHNDDLHIHNNQIIANGGTNLAGGVGLFRGTPGYRIDNNTICGNLSAEYGGGISHFGYSPGGTIDHNTIMLNQAIDEAGGIMIAGEPPLNLNTSTPDPNLLSMGAGPVAIHDNYIGDNLSYDDGGGLRFLEAGAAKFDVSNNVISDNVSAHEGGGISINDATDVHVVNNTVADNITTATAVTSDGLPAPAGLSTQSNSRQQHDFLAGRITIPQDMPDGSVQQRTCAQVTGSQASCNSMASVAFSKPLIFNDVFWDNLAGTWSSLHSSVTGICLLQNGVNLASPCQLANGQQDSSAAAPIWDGTPNHWDIGVADNSDTLSHLTPTHSLFNSRTGWPGSPSDANVVGDSVNNHNPLFKQAYLPAIAADAYRLQPRFRPSSLLTINLPDNVLGDYHINANGGARGVGIGSVVDHDASGGTTCGMSLTANQVCAPPNDIDGQARPVPQPSLNSAPDAGADQKAGPNNTQYAALIRPAAGGAAQASGAVLMSARVAADAGTPTVPAGGPAAPGVAGAKTVVPATPPSGSTINLSAVGAANAAGNTAVVQTYGGRGTINGVPAAPPQVPSKPQRAQMPGGVTGLGHFRIPGAYHVFHPAGRSVAATVLGVFNWPVALWFTAITGFGIWVGRRRRRPGLPHPEAPPSGSGDPPPGETNDASRQLALAGKGEGR